METEVVSLLKDYSLPLGRRNASRPRVLAVRNAEEVGGGVRMPLNPLS